jgi:hypothetical protein
MQEDTHCNVREWQLRCVPVSFRIVRLEDLQKMAILTPPTNSILGGQLLTSVCKLSLLKDATKHTKRFKQTSLICSTEDGKVTTMCVCVCVFLASGYGWVTVMHEILISSAQPLTSLPYPRTQ